MWEWYSLVYGGRSFKDLVVTDLGLYSRERGGKTFWVRYPGNEGNSGVLTSNKSHKLRFVCLDARNVTFFLTSNQREKSNHSLQKTLKCRFIWRIPGEGNEGEVRSRGRTRGFCTPFNGNACANHNCTLSKLEKYCFYFASVCFSTEQNNDHQSESIKSIIRPSNWTHCFHLFSRIAAVASRPHFITADAFPIFELCFRALLQTLSLLLIL